MCLKVCDARHDSLFYFEAGKVIAPADAAGNSIFEMAGSILFR